MPSATYPIIVDRVLAFPPLFTVGCLIRGGYIVRTFIYVYRPCVVTRGVYDEFLKRFTDTSKAGDSFAEDMRQCP